MSSKVDFSNYATVFTGFTFATTETSTQVNAAGVSYDGIPRCYVAKGVIDTAKTGVTNATGDLYGAVQIPAGTYVLGAYLETVTAETTGVTATMAITDSSSNVISAAAVPSTTVATVSYPTANMSTLPGTPVYAITAGAQTARMYTSADMICGLVAVAAFTNGKYNLCVICVDLNAR
ncbi:MAG: hypothetical protein ABSD50_14150 [Smithella sp.]|jgi:phosphatidylserine synthase